ncbi:hypothetical protein BX666DRAFT_1853406 [Dichotomocladium elegans]|nr:hypothetical protein BX666DRAFT_1853406 [Dichotomocladium elegans]
MTFATEKGESGAEAIALEVGAYMGECIQIIEHYGGDVVKFLGDAVLVCFQPNVYNQSPGTRSNSHGRSRSVSDRKKNILTRRAVECGMQLLLRLSHYRVYLTAEERTKHRRDNGEIDRRPSATGMAGGESHATVFDLSKNMIDDSSETSSDIQGWSMSYKRYDLRRLFRRWRKPVTEKRRPSDESTSTVRNLTEIDLELHISLSCGEVTNVILGKLEADESDKSWTASYRLFPPGGVPAEIQPSDHYVKYHGRLEYAIGGPVVESLDEALSVAKAGEMSITPEAYEIIQHQSLDYLVYDRRRQFYVVSNTGMGRRRSSNSILHGAALLSHLDHKPRADNARSRDPIPSMLSPDSLLPRVRDTASMEVPMDSYPMLMKYINRSAAYRLLQSPDGNFLPQFREATIMFVSLGRVQVASEEGLRIAQDALSLAIKVLVRYEGVLQQFAIDDKGATILGVFGLPPLSHEREAVFAAKAAIELRDKYQEIETLDFAISLASGRIFTAVVPQGNPFRRDPGIAGDAIILAVRMLKFPFSKKNVICDAPTRQQIGGLCEFDDLGENFVKGKVKPVQIYGINRFGRINKRRRLSVHPLNGDFVGYTDQMKDTIDFANDWVEAQNHHLLVISGASGTGKTFFCQNFQNAITSTDVICCWASCTEVEKNTKYFMVRNLMFALFELFDTVDVSTPQPPMSRPYTRFQDNYSGNSPGSASSDHVPGSDWLRRLALYSSRFSPTLNANRWSHDTLENEELVNLRHCLIKCGEDIRLLPLFKHVFPSITEVVEENKYTKPLDGRTRDQLLCGIILRIIQHASNTVNLILICDDLQWADPASFHVVKQIHEVCQRVMIVAATRPSVDYSVPFLKTMFNIGHTRDISLRGLSVDHVGDIILQVFPETVKKVNPMITKLIQKRTGGNPLYVKNMAVVLKDYDLVMVSDNELTPNSNRANLDSVLGDVTYNRMIKLQFDRLDRHFQEFLTASSDVASCLDQQFDIYEIHAAVSEGNYIFSVMDPEIIQQQITKLDIYKFLRPDSLANTLENSRTLYSFTHITIPKSIYDMASFETRNLLHRRLARYYEGLLTRDSYTQLLSKVTRHYMETDRIEKQIYYLEALADLDMHSHLIHEAASNFGQIAKILEKNDDISARYGLVHKSDIYRRLGICLTLRNRFNEAEMYLQQALHCLGVPWPENPIGFFYQFWQCRLTQLRHRYCRPLWIQKEPVKRELGRRTIEIMMQLCNIYYFRDNGENFIYACLTGLNVCEKIGDRGQRYTFFLARIALLSWLNDHRDSSAYYMTKAFKNMGSKPDAGALNICAILCFAAGKMVRARDLLKQSVSLTRTLGVVTDCQEFYRAVRIMITMRILEGTLDNSSEEQVLMKVMADTAHRNGDQEAELWLAIYHVANSLIMCRLEQSDPYVLWLESSVHATGEYNRLAIHGLLMNFYTLSGDRKRTLENTKEFLRLLPLLTMTANMIPVFGVIFAIFSLYRSAEQGEASFYSSIGRNYDRFLAIVNQISKAVDKIAFWEFCQPFLYLAHALPYVCTGRTVEAYSILQSGLLDMPYIHEFKFLKAYFMARLGRFAYSSEDRHTWTSEARKYFDDLCIPANEYCNPNPSKPFYPNTCKPSEGGEEDLYS